MCTDAEDAEPERDPADDLTPGRAVGLGVAHVAPADPDQDQRHEPADLADRAGDDGADALHQPAGQLPPDGGRDDDREPEQEQPDAVAAVLGLEVAGGPPDRAGDGADGVRDAEPDRGDPAAERGEPTQDRTAPRADSAGRRAPVARAASRTRAWSLLRRTPGTRREAAQMSWPCFANPAGKTYGSPW